MKVLIKNKEILIDKKDISIFNKYNWHISDTGYVVWRGNKNGKKQTIRLHRLLLNITDSKIKIDHINRNKLDNRRKNLRVCNNMENSYNRSGDKNANTKYKGVFERKINNKTIYAAYIQYNRTNLFLGNYDNIKDAALAYDRAAEKYHKNYAFLNFPKTKALPKNKRVSKFHTNYFGVSKDINSSRKKRYVARLRINGKVKYLGRYMTAKEAANAYNNAVLYYGLNLKLNEV